MHAQNGFGTWFVPIPFILSHKKLKRPGFYRSGAFQKGGGDQMEKNQIYLPGYVKNSDFFETLSKSLLYGLIIAKKVTSVNKLFRIFHTQNDSLLHLYIQFPIKPFCVIIGHTTDKVRDHQNTQIQLILSRSSLCLRMIHGFIEAGYRIHGSAFNECHILTGII